MSHQKINDIVTYVLIGFLFAPHATKQCVDVCMEQVFISPTFQAFIMPYMSMDMSLHGFLLQLLWTPPFILNMWGLFWLRDHHVYGKVFKIYVIRWIIFFVILTILYNLIFWGGLREYVLPSFVF